MHKNINKKMTVSDMLQYDQQTRWNSKRQQSGKNTKEFNQLNQM